MLVLLMMAATGAWAQEQSETIATTDNNIVEGTHFTISNGGEYADEVGMCAYGGGITVTSKNGETITKVVISCTYGPDCVDDDNTSVSSGTKEITNGGLTITVTGVNASTFTFTCSDDGAQFGQFVVYYTEASEPAPSGTPVAIAWTAASKTGTFSMPGGNVELEPEYYPQATADGAVTAATGVAATTDAPLVTVDETMLTGVAKMMYYVSTSTTAPAYDAEGWTDVLPTAANYTEAGNLNVWYYPVGTDEGVGGATATYSDGDICATALTVTLAPAPAPTADVTLTDGDGITALSSHTGQTITVAYTRSFTASTASTVCLPFAYTKKAADGSFYAFTNIEKVGSDYVATMTEPGLSTLEANTPYLYLPNATGDFSFSGTYTIPATLTAGSVTSNGWTFKGTYEPIEWTTAPTGIYGFSGQTVGGISQGQFVKVGAYVRIAPMRCYLENASFAGARSENGTNDEVLPETIKVRLISANGTVTAIGSLSTKTGEVTLDNDAWYSLDGRRVQNPAKGVYIKNGKKVVIK